MHYYEDEMMDGDEDADMDGLEDEANVSEFEGEDEFGGKNKKPKNSTRGVKKDKGGKKPSKWNDAFDDSGNDNEEKRQKKKEARPKRQAAQKKELINPNMIKTSNKLIGEIENADLYNSDEDALPQNHEILNNGDIDMQFGGKLN